MPMDLDMIIARIKTLYIYQNCVNTIFVLTKKAYVVFVMLVIGVAVCNGRRGLSAENT
jgi:hypothetical protein